MTDPDPCLSTTIPVKLLRVLSKVAKRSSSGALSHVRMQGSNLEACDGACLIKISCDQRLERLERSFDPVLLSQGSVKRLVKASKIKAELPAPLRNFAGRVVIDGSETGSHKHIVDGRTIEDDSDDYTWPNTLSVIPEPGPRDQQVGVNLALLREACDALMAAGFELASFEATKSNAPLVLRGAKDQGVDGYPPASEWAAEGLALVMPILIK